MYTFVLQISTQLNPVTEGREAASLQMVCLPGMSHQAQSPLCRSTPSSHPARASNSAAYGSARLSGETTEPGRGCHAWRNVGAAAGGRGERGGGVTVGVVIGLPSHLPRSGDNQGRVFGH